MAVGWAMIRHHSFTTAFVGVLLCASVAWAQNPGGYIPRPAPAVPSGSTGAAPPPPSSTAAAQAALRPLEPPGSITPAGTYQPNRRAPEASRQPIINNT